MSNRNVIKIPPKDRPEAAGDSSHAHPDEKFTSQDADNVRIINPKHYMSELVKSDVGRLIREDRIDIPMLPEVAVRVMALSRVESTSLNEIAKAISDDQYLAGRVIRMANSAFYMGLKEIISLPHAVLHLGLRTLRNLVLAMSIERKIFLLGSHQRTMERMREHSLGAAVVAEKIAIELHRDESTAFFHGLMHDIGKPLLLHVIDDILARRRYIQDIDEHVVIEIIDEYHCFVGGMIARKWSFPDSLSEAIVEHHDYASAKGNPTVHLIAATDIICHHLGIGCEATPMDATGFDVMRSLGLERKLDNLLYSLPLVVSEFLDSFSFES